MTTARPLYHPEHLPDGLVIDGWRIRKRLGSGGFGAVYLVEKEGVRAALKMARQCAAASPQDAGHTEERTLRELICELRISHPNVVRVLAHGRWPDPQEGYVYLVMEYVEGDTLKAWARRNAPTVRETLRLFVKLSDALQAAHRLGILHRDLKPANVLVRRQDGEPKVLDFGAGDFPQADPLTGEVLPPGTMTHRSPEAVRFERLHSEDTGARYEYQPTDDLYALGATFYEVLTGKAPFLLEPSPVGPKRLAMEIELRTPPAPHELNPHVPPALSHVVMRLLSKEPLARHASAEALRRDLASLDEPGAALDVLLWDPGASQAQRDATPTPTPMVATPPTVVRSRGLHRAAELAALLGVVVVLGLLALFLTRGTGAPPSASAPPLEARTEPHGPAPRPPVPPATTPGATLEPAPMLNASPQQEGPTVTTPAAPIKSPSTSTTPTAPRKAPGSAILKETCRALLVGSTAWLAAGCAAGVQVRPEPAACPEEARQGLIQLSWGFRGSIPEVLLDVNQPETEFRSTGRYRSGPIVSRLTEPHDEAPAGTLLYGRLWVDEKESAVWGRWTEAELPGGRKVPVCVELGPNGEPYPIGEPYATIIQPGVVKLGKRMPLYPVARWTGAEGG